MPPVGALIIIAFLVIFAGTIAWIVALNRSTQARQQETAHTLGFQPIEPSEELVEQISGVYRRHRPQVEYRLENVYQRRMPDGDMFLFDLVDAAGEDGNQSEQQSLAVVSPGLNLPHFLLFPRASFTGLAGSLANRLLEWAASQAGEQIEFPDAPGFGERYLLTSLEPEQVRSFFHPSLLQQLAQTRQGAVQAWGQVFIYSQIAFNQQPTSQESLSQRVNEARNILRILQM